jgi:hypothetical protein
MKVLLYTVFKELAAADFVASSVTSFGSDFFAENRGKTKQLFRNGLLGSERPKTSTCKERSFPQD